MKKLVIALLAMSLFVGCARIDPFSPKQRQQIQNQDGKIEEIKSNTQGVQAELLKLRQQTEINARDMDRTQTGMMNKQNTGVQIFQGDGALFTIIVLAGLVVGCISLIAYYKSKNQKSEKIAEVLATQISLRNDIELEDAVFMAAMHTEVEPDIYRLMIKKQTMMRKRGLR